jgi:hypothetical protein
MWWGSRFRFPPLVARALGLGIVSENPATFCIALGPRISALSRKLNSVKARALVLPFFFFSTNHRCVFGVTRTDSKVVLPSLTAVRGFSLSQYSSSSRAAEIWAPAASAISATSTPSWWLAGGRKRNSEPNCRLSKDSVGILLIKLYRAYTGCMETRTRLPDRDHRGRRWCLGRARSGPCICGNQFQDMELEKNPVT